jgi:hypothetical protein
MSKFATGRICRGGPAAKVAVVNKAVTRCWDGRCVAGVIRVRLAAGLQRDEPTPATAPTTFRSVVAGSPRTSPSGWRTCRAQTLFSDPAPIRAIQLPARRNLGEGR